MAPPESSNRRSWPLDVMGSKYLAVRASDLRENEAAFTAHAALQVIERAIHHPTNPRQLSDLGQALTRSGLRSVSTPNWNAVLSAFRSGEMVLLKRSVPVPLTRATREESVEAQLKSAKLVKTWVEMEVVDMEGNPVQGKRFLCALPDGSVQEGVLDRTGRVRFDGIDPGNCSFMLADQDRESWERVS